jgi:hypothetical protein
MGRSRPGVQLHYGFTTWSWRCQSAANFCRLRACRDRLGERRLSDLARKHATSRHHEIRSDAATSDFGTEGRRFESLYSRQLSCVIWQPEFVGDSRAPWHVGGRSSRTARPRRQTATDTLDKPESHSTTEQPPGTTVLRAPSSQDYHTTPAARTTRNPEPGNSKPNLRFLPNEPNFSA